MTALFDLITSYFYNLNFPACGLLNCNLLPCGPFARKHSDNYTIQPLLSWDTKQLRSPILILKK